MALFNDSIPSDDESIKLGASRIREMETSLNTMLSQIFTDALEFLPKWITGDLIANDATTDGSRAISSDHLKNDSVILRTLPDGVFTADAPGRAKFESGFVSSDLLDPAITYPAGSVVEDAIGAGAVTEDKLGALAVTIAKVGAGVAKIAIGTYAGSDSSSISITGLAFAPDFVIITSGKNYRFLPAIAFKAEAVAGTGSFYAWGLPGASLPNPVDQDTLTNAIQWTSDGFIIVPVNTPSVNDGGQTHTYLALGS